MRVISLSGVCMCWGDTLWPFLSNLTSAICIIFAAWKFYSLHASYAFTCGSESSNRFEHYTYLRVNEDVFFLFFLRPPIWQHYCRWKQWAALMNLYWMSIACKNKKKHQRSIYRQTATASITAMTTIFIIFNVRIKSTSTNTQHAYTCTNTHTHTDIFTSSQAKYNTKPLNFHHLFISDGVFFAVLDAVNII